MNEKKPRSEYVYVTTAGETTEISLDVDPTTGQVRFGLDVINTRVETSYEREKGPKVLNRTPVDREMLLLDPNQALARNFDLLFAIDTNTQSIRGYRISVTGVLEISHTIDPDTGHPALAYRTPFCLEFMQVAQQHEQLGWMMAMQEIEVREEYGKFARIGIVVDSDLGSLPAYNARALPVHGEWLLPERFTLIYASADAGSEYLTNQLIRFADKASRQVLSALRDGTAPLNTKRVEGAPFAAFRRIFSKRSAAG